MIRSVIHRVVGCRRSHTFKITDELAGLPTRLAAVSDTQQQRLINWGYTICDTGIRKHVMPDLQPGQLPYPAIPLTNHT